MPEIKIRKRLARRSGDWRYRLRRWLHHRRSMVAVGVAFLLAVSLACIAFGLTANMAGGGSGDDGQSDSQAG